MKDIYYYIMIRNLPIYFALMFLVFGIAIPMIKQDGLIGHIAGSFFIFVAMILIYWNGCINMNKIQQNKG